MKTGSRYVPVKKVAVVRGRIIWKRHIEAEDLVEAELENEVRKRPLVDKKKRNKYLIPCF